MTGALAGCSADPSTGTPSLTGSPTTAPSATSKPGSATSPPTDTPGQTKGWVSAENLKPGSPHWRVGPSITAGEFDLAGYADRVSARPGDQVTQDSFSAAIGVPMTVILPMVAILAVTSEWTQRSGLTTFTLVPHRERVIGAKVLATLAIAVSSMTLALAIGALGNIVGSVIAGVDTVWDLGFQSFLLIVLANTLGMMIGFMLGIVIRNSPGAIVGYFVISFVLPGLFMVLANAQSWFADMWPWVDFNYAQGALYNGSLTGTEWANLGVTGLVWLIIPTAIGLRLVMRSEVK